MLTLHTTPTVDDNTAEKPVDGLTVSLMISAFVHEVNNPLAFVFSNIEFIQDKILKIKGSEGTSPINHDADTSDAFDDITYGLQKIKDVMNDMRACFPIHAQESKEPISLSHAIDFCLISMRHHSKEHLRIIKDVHESLRAYGVKFHILYTIMQALRRLIESAPDQDPERHLSIYGYQANEYVCLDMTYKSIDNNISDQKMGITMQFDVFSMP
jgi:two-component system, NtrC family, sensor kinase